MSRHSLPVPLVALTLLLALAAVLPAVAADGWQRAATPDLPLADGRGVAVHPADGDLAYALVGAQAVARSTDGGTTWSTVGFAPLDSPFYRDAEPDRFLAVDPRRSERVLVGAFDGLWLSDDGRPFAAAGPLRQRPRAVAFDTASAVSNGGDADRWLVGYDDGGIFLTEDDGLTWRRLAEPAGGNYAVGALAVDPRDGNRLLVLLTEPIDGSCSPGGCRGLYESTDGGASWNALRADASGSILLFAPSDPARLVVQIDETTLGRGTNGGLLGFELVDLGTLLVDFNASLVDVAFDPADTSRLWAAGSSGEVLRSTDGGASWTIVTFFILPVSDLATTDGLLLASLASPETPGPGVLRSIDGGVTWTETDGLDSVNWAQVEPIGGSADSVLATAGALILRTDDAGASWTTLFGGGTGIFIDLERAPSDPSVLYAGGRTDGDSLWRSTDGGATWQPRSGDLIEPVISVIAIDPQDPDHLLVSAGIFGADGLYASSDGGDTWQLVLDESIFTLVFDPSAPQVVYANAFEDLYRSLDGGATWTSLGTAPVALDVDADGTLWLTETTALDLLRSDDRGDSFVRVGSVPYANGIGLVFDASRGADGILAFGTTDGGVLRSLDGGRSWLRLAPGLPPAPLGDLAIADDGTVWAMSLGAGAYRGSFDAPPLATTSERFLATVSWRDFQGATGTGTAALRTDDTGTFWFFDEANLELMIKVLDGRAVNGHWWVYYGALSNVEFTLTVTDTVTGEESLYFNPLGTFASFGDVEAFAEPQPVIVGEAARPAPAAAQATTAETPIAADTKSSHVLELGDRFRASITWRDFGDITGEGVAVPLTGDGGDTGAFYFFSPQNLEMMVKVLDGRPVNGHFWVFFGSLSNVEFTLRIEDTETGAVKEYVNPRGDFSSLGDVEAF